VDGEETGWVEDEWEDQQLEVVEVPTYASTAVAPATPCGFVKYWALHQTPRQASIFLTGSGRTLLLFESPESPRVGASKAQHG